MELQRVLEDVSGDKVKITFFEIDEESVHYVLFIDNFPFAMIQVFKAWSLGERMGQFVSLYYWVVQAMIEEKEKEELYSQYV